MLHRLPKSPTAPVVSAENPKQRVFPESIPSFAVGLINCMRVYEVLPT